MRTRLCSTAFDFDWDISCYVLNLEQTSALLFVLSFITDSFVFWMETAVWCMRCFIYVPAISFFSSSNAYDSIVSLLLNAIRLCSKWANVENIEKSNDYVVLHMHIISKPKKVRIDGDTWPNWHALYCNASHNNHTILLANCVQMPSFPNKFAFFQI